LRPDKTLQRAVTSRGARRLTSDRERRPSTLKSLERRLVVGKYSLQLRIEFQNIFNRLSLSAPSAGNPTQAVTTTTYAGQTLNNAGFGTIATLGGGGDAPRSGQAVMRFTF